MTEPIDLSSCRQLNPYQCWRSPCCACRKSVALGHTTLSSITSFRDTLKQCTRVATAVTNDAHVREGAPQERGVKRGGYQATLLRSFPFFPCYRWPKPEIRYSFPFIAIGRISEEFVPLKLKCKTMYSFGPKTRPLQASHMDNALALAGGEEPGES